MVDLRHIVVAVGCALAASGLGAGAASATTQHAGRPPAGTNASSSASSTLTISGRGFGHGVGLAQDGDLALGRQGKTMPQILGAFYPGTRFASVGDVTLRVAVEEAKATGRIVVTLPAGGAVRAGGSGVLVAKGGSVALTHGTKGYAATLLNPPKRLRPSETVSRGSAPYTVSSPGLIVDAATGRSYHGTVSAVADGDALRAINSVDVETYLHGLGEVRDPSWPAASLQALAVAARTYALHSQHPGAIFDLWDDDRSQVYLGASGEYAALTAAVEKTRGLVLTYAGGLADTVYSASGGGVTATPAEGFGDTSSTSAQEPYLRAATYPTLDPLVWSVSLPLSIVAAALHYPGQLRAVTVSALGPSGRPTAVTLTGTAGTRIVTGLDLYHQLRLRSTLFTIAGPPSATTPPAATGATGAPAGATAPATPAPTGPATPVAAATTPSGPTKLALPPAAGGQPEEAVVPAPLRLDGAPAPSQTSSVAGYVGGIVTWTLAALAFAAAVTARRRRV